MANYAQIMERARNRGMIRAAQPQWSDDNSEESRTKSIPVLYAEEVGSRHDELNREAIETFLELHYHEHTVRSLDEMHDAIRDDLGLRIGRARIAMLADAACVDVVSGRRALSRDVTYAILVALLLDESEGE